MGVNGTSATPFSVLESETQIPGGPNHVASETKCAEFQRGRYRELSQNWHPFLPGQIETADTNLLTFRR
jgi:hypothetical protein